MKKLFTLSFLLLCFGYTRAQLTTTAASFPGVGNVFIDVHQDTLITIAPGASGANQSWNFAAINNDYQDTTSFMAVSVTPNGNLFPAANLAALQGGAYAYFNLTASELDMIGLSGDPGVGFNITANFLTPDIIAKAGVTYNSSYNFNNGLLVTIDATPLGITGVDSARIHRNKISTRIVDGWGTVTSPMGTFPCLRRKERDSTITVVDGYNAALNFWIPGIFSQTQTTVSYSYIDNTTVDPIVTINMDTTSSTVNNVSYRQATNTGVTANTKPSLFTLYPDPAKAGNIHLLIGGLADNNYTVKIFDQLGRELFSAPYFINAVNVTDVELNSLHLSAGTYFATVAGKGNKALQALQFEVVK